MYLGDIHGNFNLIREYINIYRIKNAHIIQVGDFGVGFNSIEKEKKELDKCNKKLIENNVFLWAIRGNHDFKPYFDNDPFNFTNIKLVPDYTVLNLSNKNILCIGGATSVDRKLRYKNQKNVDFKTLTKKENWWQDEVFYLNREKISELRDINIVVTHTAPYYCPPDNTFGFGEFVEDIIKYTNDLDLKRDLIFERQQLAEAFNLIKLNNDIEKAYYGHFHKSDCINIYGVSHRLLNIGELWEERA